MVLIDWSMLYFLFFFFQAEDGIRDGTVTGVQTCALPIWGITSGFTVRRRDGGLSGGLQLAEASAVHLHSEVGIRRRSSVVARSFPNDCAPERRAGERHQVYGAGGIASAGVSDGRVRLEFARPYLGTELGALG